jgi:Rho GTPase-activating protein 1
MTEVLHILSRANVLQPFIFFIGQVISLETFGDPHLAAILLKKYIKDLPEPLFPERLYPTIRRCPPPTDDPSDISSVTYIRDSILRELMPCAYILLSNVLRKQFHISIFAANVMN